ncbi:MAG: aminotransferase class III-fold pyridoxal phosphate-dependent enzyme [Actinobacteria bacterium]|nr:aminotransferase class III-fold pyridoxal phosphate-dependent enzyme [Actinomycetota bacterium]
MPPVERKRTESRRLSERAARVMPTEASTLSKGPARWVPAVFPTFLVRGSGGHVWDADGNEWIDFPMGLGPVLLGHADPQVNAAIRAQLDDGIAFTLMHPLEVEVAERIVDMCPSVEAVRFAKTGSDATSAAVRVARSATGRTHVAVCGYHGWHEWFAASTDSCSGVPPRARDEVSSFNFNDLADLDRLASQVDLAAVIVEPSGAALPEPGFLDGVVDLCRRVGAVSVFDEISTGFRIARGGARERYGVAPDLSCYGKALGNGMPIAAVAGGRDVMDEFDRVFVSGTNIGEVLSLAAAKVVLDEVANGDVIATVAAIGRRIIDGARELICRHGVDHLVSVGGEAARPVISFHGPHGPVARSWAQSAMAQRGVLFTGTFLPCVRHSELDVDEALTAFDYTFAALSRTTDLDAFGQMVLPRVRP